MSDLLRVTEVAAGGVVHRRKAGRLQFCIVNTHNGADWQFPKGHQDPGETLEQTALREVKEEAGLDAEILLPLGRTQYDIPKKNKVIDKQVEWYLMRHTGGDLTADGKEVTAIEWVGPDEARARLTYENEREVLGLALAGIEKLGDNL